MGSNNLLPITVKTSIQSTINKVWNCWTNPAHITNWNFASSEWYCPNAENDLQTNGQFSYRMEAKDGSMGFDFTGIYEQIIVNELITYKMEDGRLVRIELSEKEGVVTISETFDAEGTNSDEQQRAGWQAILENFKTYVEAEQ